MPAWRKVTRLPPHRAVLVVLATRATSEPRRRRACFHTVPCVGSTSTMRLASALATRTCTGPPLSRHLSSSRLQRRHDSVVAACADTSQRGGTVHLAEKLLLDEHVDTLCALLRGDAPPVAGRIFLERNGIGSARMSRAQGHITKTVWVEWGQARRLHQRQRALPSGPGLRLATANQPPLQRSAGRPCHSQFAFVMPHTRFAFVILPS